MTAGTILMGRFSDMDILYYNEGEDINLWMSALKKALPQANIRHWYPLDEKRADYALVWQAPDEVFLNREGLKAVINLGAGVDTIINHPLINKDIPIYRLRDAGMAVQLAEYVTYFVMRYFRGFDSYEKQQSLKLWQMIEPTSKSNFTIGIMGLGSMGETIANHLLNFGFNVIAWRRSNKKHARITCYSGMSELTPFLKQSCVLICVLPLTKETKGILNKTLFQQLPQNSFLIHIGRGAHLIEEDLLDALATKQIQAAALDVTPIEPLPQNSLLWDHPNVSLTPHIAGLTFCEETVQEIASLVLSIEQNKPIFAPVNKQLGY